MMYQLIKGFPEQLEEGLEIMAKVALTSPPKAIHQVLIAGMGGSGIGGKLVGNLVQDSCTVPIFLSRDYQTPAWVGPQTLAIASSYSGNTEETLAAAHELLEKQAHFIAVTSGGKLAALAQEHHKEIVFLPSGYSAPRACLGFSVVAELVILKKLQLVKDDVVQKMERITRFLRKYQAEIEDKARQMATLLVDKTPIIYSSPLFEATAIRFRQQLNENSKVLAWHHVIPEMNHNEVVGWHQPYRHYAVILLESSLDHPRNKLRQNFVKELTGHFAGSLIRTKAKGADLWEQTFYLVHLLDFVSTFLAENRQVDVMAIHAIDTLKEMLNHTPE